MTEEKHIIYEYRLLGVFKQSFFIQCEHTHQREKIPLNLETIVNYAERLSPYDVIILMQLLGHVKKANC